jgi:two-component system chemotaxis response regulator CheB
MNIIVIGGSAGSLPVLKQIIEKIPKSFSGSIFIVVHIGPKEKSVLDTILRKYTKLSVKFAEDKEKIEEQKIYLAPPDYHLMLMEGRMRLTKGAKENWSRPAIDVLFRSAAAAYGQEVAGIVLSGRLFDGTAGLSDIKDSGGVTIVQEPTEAFAPNMPANALKNVDIDYTLTGAEMAELLPELVKQKSKNKTMEKSEAFKWELSIAEGHEPTLEEMKKFGVPSRFICPQCEGPLFEIDARHPRRYRCVVGHAFSEGTIRKEVSAKVDFLLAAAYRTLGDKKSLLDNIEDETEEIKSEREKVSLQMEAFKKMMGDKV